MNDDQIKLLTGMTLLCSRGGGMGICEMASCFSSNAIVTIDAESDMPTDDELHLLKAYTRFKCAYFGDENNRFSSGANTTILCKGVRGEGWRYRRMTWSVGPYMVPPEGENNLYDLLLKVENLVPKHWIEWMRKEGINAPETNLQESAKGHSRSRARSAH